MGSRTKIQRLIDFDSGFLRTNTMTRLGIDKHVISVCPIIYMIKIRHMS